MSAKSHINIYLQKCSKLFSIIYKFIINNPLNISVSLTILSLLALFITKNFYVIIISLLLGFVSVLIYKYGCKNCKRLFTISYSGKEYIETKLVPYRYRFETRYLYSNGNYMDSKYSEEQTRKERVEHHRHIYKCKSCGHCVYNYFTKNLDEDTRPDLILDTITTSIKEPKECVICGSPLRTRRKYCSKCRPSGRSRPYDY